MTEFTGIALVNSRSPETQPASCVPPPCLLSRAQAIALRNALKPGAETACSGMLSRSPPLRRVERFGPTEMNSAGIRCAFSVTVRARATPSIRGILMSVISRSTVQPRLFQCIQSLDPIGCLMDVARPVRTDCRNARSWESSSASKPGTASCSTFFPASERDVWHNASTFQANICGNSRHALSP